MIHLHLQALAAVFLTLAFCSVALLSCELNIPTLLHDHHTFPGKHYGEKGCKDRSTFLTMTFYFK